MSMLLRFSCLVMLAVMLAGCSPPNPGSAEAAFDGLVSTLEDGDIGRLDALLAQDFVGAADRPTTMAMARQAFKRGSNPRITILSQEKEESPMRATFRTQMLIVSGGGVFPQHSARLEVDTQWERGKSGWKLRVAQWHRL